MSRMAVSMLLLALCMPARADLPATLAPRVALETSHGRIVIEIDTVRAPLSAENFLRYVRDGFYDGTIFHRVISNFVVQGGGFDDQLKAREGRATIPNESGNGLSNLRGALGLAREDTPHSGSSQFYVNLKDNPGLNPLPSRWGYTVFGKVVEGMEVVDQIAYLPTATVESFAEDVPISRPKILRAYVMGEETQAEPGATEPRPAEPVP